MRCKQKWQRKEFLDLKKIEFGEHKRRYIPVPFLDDGNGCEKVRRICWRSPGRARKQRRRVHPRKGARSLCSPGFDIKLRVGNCRHLRRLVEKGQYSAVWRKNGVGCCRSAHCPSHRVLRREGRQKKKRGFRIKVAAQPAMGTAVPRRIPRRTFHAVVCERLGAERSQKVTATTHASR